MLNAVAMEFLLDLIALAIPVILEAIAHHLMLVAAPSKLPFP
jgi:hypothetical protein